MAFHDLIKKLKEREEELVKEVVRRHGLPPGSKTDLWSIAFWSVIVAAGLVFYWVSTKH
jgi:hypothetical protein